MIHSITSETPIFQLSVGQFIDLMAKKDQSTISAPTAKEKRYVYGLAGLCKILGCSHPTAQRIKDSGRIPFTQVGRKLIFDADAVLAALNHPAPLKPHRYAKSGL
ncbi:DUF3853 family protein [Dyadobacter sp. 3J3]|uniref:DUF3853 family protein n=1 Tax=Dyadobacter sp. 3J3 TaxID=2606600 RepID=UPI0013578820|nr:DUF3853 family protein [Dyadobacter sp. 3J3]